MPTLKLLADTKSPNLIDFDREGIITDLVTAIKSDPDWTSLWDGELLQNASFMFMNYCAFMAEKGYNQFNRAVRENFLYEAKDPASITNILAQRNINLFQNRASTVRVTASVVDSIVTDNMLVTDFQGNKLLSIPVGTQIDGSDTNGNSTTFEAINIAQDGKPDYKNDVKVVMGQSNRINFEFDMIAGASAQEDFLLGPEHDKNFYIDLETNDIIDNSIRIYWEFGTPDEIELPEVDAFGPAIKLTDSEDIQRWGDFFPFGIPSYVVKFNTEGGCRIYFGSDRFGGSFKNQQGKVLTVFVRSGGGQLSNISAGKINYSTEITINSSTTLSLYISNENGASGGADRETLAEAKVFAPLRNENDKTVVTDRDALSILNHYSNKVKVLSPYHDSSTNKVPILHSYNFIAPVRNFTDFVFPIIVGADSKETYKAKFESALNEFLNLKGIKDAYVTGEALGTFFYDRANDNYNFFAKLADSNPMNGSLVLKAFKYNGAKTDQIEFDLNYLSGTVFNTSKRVPARVYSLDPFVNITSSFSVPSNQNTLIINIDNTGDLTIELASITYINPSAFASAFNSLVSAGLESIAPEYWSARQNHTWVYYEEANKRLVIESPTVGFPSSIKIKAPTNNSALASLGITPNYYEPTLKTENVFLDDTTYNVSTDEVFLSIRRNNTARSKEWNETALNTILVQNPEAATGPVYEIQLLDRNDIEIEQIVEGSNILVDFYVEQNNSLVLKEEFRVKIPLVKRTGNTIVNNFNGVGSLVPPADSIVKFETSTFDYDTCKIKLEFVDSLGLNNSLPIVPPYIGNFDPSIDKVKITYKYKIPSSLTYPDATMLWGGSELANILTTGPATVLPIGGQIKDNTNVLVTLLDENNNVVSGTATLMINSGTGAGNIVFTFNTFPTCYANSVVVSKTGTPNDFLTLTLQNGFNFGTSFASYPATRKIKKVKIEYTTEDQVVETITNVSHPNFFVQNALSGTGPELDYVLDKNFDEISEDVNILVEALAGVTVKESFELPSPILFDNTASGSYILGPIANPNGFFKHNNSIPQIDFYKITSGPNVNKVNLTLRVKDSLSIPNAPVPPYLINPLVGSVKKMVVHYERKSYEYITADYKQDIYYPVEEAKIISDILNGASAKMIGFHHLMKRVEFVPFSTDLLVTVKKGYSPITATAQTKALLQKYFGYSNNNFNHSVGTGISYSEIKTILNRSDLNLGVEQVEIIKPSTTVLDETELGNRYYFILPDLILDQLYYIEQNNPQIAGISEYYTSIVNTKKI